MKGCNATLESSWSSIIPMISSPPEEVARYILEFSMDLPTLSALIQTNKSCVLSILANDDRTWAILIKRRYDIDTSNTARSIARSKTYGGATWKTAYRSLSIAGRIPRCRFTAKKKTVFAKHPLLLLGTDPRVATADVGDAIGACVWVMLGHTENCCTRTAVVTNTGGHRRLQRFIELHICLQNTNTASGATIRADFCKTYVRLASGAVGRDYRKIPVLTTGLQKPRILYKRHLYATRKPYYAAAATSLVHPHHALTYHRQASDSEGSNYYSDEREALSSDDDSEPRKSPIAAVALHPSEHACLTSCVVTLNPLEYAIVAVNVPCSSDMFYETDFLSRAMTMSLPLIINEQLRMHVPMSCPPDNQNDAVTDSNDSNNKEQFLSEYRKYVTGNSFHADPVPVQWAKVSYPALITASFLPEKDVWNNYIELPGGCLARVHRSL